MESVREAVGELHRSVALLLAFRTEQTDPEPFYRLLAEDSLAQISRHLDVANSWAIDLGGGSGHFAQALRRAGGRCLLVERERTALTSLVNLRASSLRHHVDPSVRADLPPEAVIADGYRLPIQDGALDLGVCSNVLEHVGSPWALVDELARVVRRGGIVYLSFTNWYSPWGGHETSPWHYLGGHFAARRYQRRHGMPPVHRYGDSLFALHVGNAIRELERRDDLDVVAAMPRYHPRWLSGLVRVPWLREAATWNLLVILRRR
jgi:SAM-dependent methyltransferase